MNNRLFLLLSLLFLLASCGGQQGKVSLKVTNSFNVSNSVFNGGLYIHGQKLETGEVFSFALNSQNSVSLELGFGTWNIRAVGWHRDPQTATATSPIGPMEGDVFCGQSQINFNSDSSISISTTKEKCFNDAFASSEFWQSTVNGSVVRSFKTTPVHPCGALYDLNDSTQLRTAPLVPNFCEDYPTSFQMKPRGMKFELSSISPEALSETKFASACIPLTANAAKVEGFYHANKIPTKIPLSLVFYQSSSCDERTIMGDFRFRQGLDHSLSRTDIGFDAILSKDPASPLLAVSFPLSRRGTSSLVKEMPEFKCVPTSNVRGQLSPEKCFQFPPLPVDGAVPAQFVLQNGYNSIQLPSDIVCDNTSTISSATQGIFTKQKCEITEKGTVLEVLVNSAREGFESFTLTHNGKPVTIKVFIKNEIHHFNQLRRILGVKDSNSHLKNSFGNEEDERYGILENLSEFFSPAMVGGLFWDRPCSANSLYYPTTRHVSLWDEGSAARKDYQVTLLGLDRSRRRISIAQVNAPSSEVDEMILNFECTTASQPMKIGQLEERRNEFGDNGAREQKRLVIWNTTEDTVNSAFEEYRIESQTDKTSAVVFQSSSFTRARKFGLENAKIETLNYFFDKRSGTPRENVNYNEYYLIGTNFTSRSHPGIQVSEGHPGLIFSDNINLGEKIKIRSGTTQLTHPITTKITDPIKTGPEGSYLKADIVRDQVLVRYRLKGMSTDQYEIIPVDNLQAATFDLSEDGSKAILAIVKDVSDVNDNYSTRTIEIKSCSNPRIKCSWVTRIPTVQFGPMTMIKSIKSAVLNSGEVVTAIIEGKKGESISDRLLFLTQPATNSKPLVTLQNSTNTFTSTQDTVDATPVQVSYHFTNPTSNFVVHDSFENTQEVSLAKHNELIWLAFKGKDGISLLRPSGSSYIREDLVKTNDILKIDLTSFNNQLILSYLVLTGPQMIEKSYPLDVKGSVTKLGNPFQRLTNEKWPEGISEKLWSTTTLQYTNENTPNISTSYLNGPYVDKPYIRPLVPNFDINYMSLNPERMRVNVFGINPQTK